MSLLMVGFTEGFSHDEVHIKVNGREVFSEVDVTSKLATRYADEWRGTVEEHASLEIELPRKRLSTQFQLEGGTRYVAVSLDGHILEAQQLSQVTPPM